VASDKKFHVPGPALRKKAIRLPSAAPDTALFQHLKPEESGKSVRSRVKERNLKATR
jgi:hypothetical protein